MSEQSRRYEQAAVDALVAGDANKLEPALRRLAKSDAIHFSVVVQKLLNTHQQNLHSTMTSPPFTNTLPRFYHDSGVVYAATYLDTPEPHMKQAFPSGKGLAYGKVFSVIERVRSEHDVAVMKRVRELEAHMKDVIDQMYAHSTADPGLLRLASPHLRTGCALLIAAVPPAE